MNINNSGTLLRSTGPLKYLSKDIDPWQSSSYTSSGIFYSEKASWYFFVFNGLIQGVPKEVFEHCLVHIPQDNKEVDDKNGVSENLFLKTVAMLTSHTTDYKML